MHSSRRPSRKPGSGGITPAFPQIGSTMTAATSPGLSAKTSRTAPKSLNSTAAVWAATAAGTPGLVGTPSVAAPEPAFTRNASEWP